MGKILKEKRVRSAPYILEYAVSSRALCRICKTTIPKYSLRLGTYKLPYQGPYPGSINPPCTPVINPKTPAHGVSYQFQHWGCIPSGQLSLLAEGGESLDGFDELKEEDKTKVREAFERGWVQAEGRRGKPVGTKYKQVGWKGRKKAKRWEGNLGGAAKKKVEVSNKTHDEKKARELGEPAEVDNAEEEEAEDEEENQEAQEQRRKGKARAPAVDAPPAKRAKLPIPPPAASGSSTRTSGKIATNSGPRPQRTKKNPPPVFESQPK